MLNADAIIIHKPTHKSIIVSSSPRFHLPSACRFLSRNRDLDISLWNRSIIDGIYKSVLSWCIVSNCIGHTYTQTFPPPHFNYLLPDMSEIRATLPHGWWSPKIYHNNNNIIVCNSKNDIAHVARELFLTCFGSHRLHCTPVQQIRCTAKCTRIPLIIIMIRFMLGKH